MLTTYPDIYAAQRHHNTRKLRLDWQWRIPDFLAYKLGHTVQCPNSAIELGGLFASNSIASPKKLEVNEMKKNS